MGKCLVFMLSLCRQTDRRMDRRATVKQYAPDLSIQGHKNHDVRPNRLSTPQCVKEI